MLPGLLKYHNQLLLTVVSVRGIPTCYSVCGNAPTHQQSHCLYPLYSDRARLEQGPSCQGSVGGLFNIPDTQGVDVKTKAMKLSCDHLGIATRLAR